MSTALPSSLLRRVAEVVDAQSAGDDVFVAAARRFPYDVACVLSTRRETEACARQQQLSDYAVLGPLIRRPGLLEGRIPAEAAAEKLALIKAAKAGCHHTSSSAYSDGSGQVCGREVVQIRDVAAIRITTAMKDGQSSTVSFTPDSVDAVFFTLDAMDKFVFPYYARVYGVTYAAGMRADIVGRFGRQATR